MKYLVKGTIRLIVEADNEEEAQDELSDALQSMSQDEPFGDWDQIETSLVCELDDDDC